MIHYKEKEIMEAYNALPEKIQEMILDEDLGFFIQAIGREHGMSPEQSLDIEYMVMYIILGFYHSSYLEKLIDDEFDIQGHLAWEISKTIRKEIFSESEEVINTGAYFGEPKKAHKQYQIPEKEDEPTEDTQTTTPILNTQIKTGQYPYKKPPKIPLPQSKLSDSITSIPATKREHPFEEKLKALRSNITTPTPPEKPAGSEADVFPRHSVPKQIYSAERSKEEVIPPN